ncbi:hypothetical protein [Lonepinella sp. MS14436]
MIICSWAAKQLYFSGCLKKQAEKSPHFAGLSKGAVFSNLFLS